MNKFRRSRLSLIVQYAYTWVEHTDTYKQNERKWLEILDYLSTQANQ